MHYQAHHVKQRFPQLRPPDLDVSARLALSDASVEDGGGEEISEPDIEGQRMSYSPKGKLLNERLGGRLRDMKQEIEREAKRRGATKDCKITTKVSPVLRYTEKSLSVIWLTVRFFGLDHRRRQFRWCSLSRGTNCNR